MAYIPAGFSVGVSGRINTIEKGLVIQDENGNQFVWVPVDNAIKNPSTNITEQYTPMAMNQTGKNSKYYEGIFYLISNEGKFSYNLAQKIGSNGYREPSLVTINVNGSNIYTWDIENSIIKTENRDTSKMFYKTSSRYNSAEVQLRIKLLMQVILGIICTIIMIVIGTHLIHITIQKVLYQVCYGILNIVQ